MKKSFLCALVLVLSSFFFISINKVEAYEIEINYDLSVINDTFFKVRDLAESNKYYSKYGRYFIIINTKNVYSVLFPTELEKTGTCNDFNDTFNCSIYSNLLMCEYKDSNLVCNGSRSSYFARYSTGEYIVYSNFNFSFSTLSSFKIVNLDKELVSGDNFIFPYDVYKKKYLIHEDEQKVIKTFYTICINKISLLTEKIASNYIYLSMIVVLILVFIIELIRRWLT